MYVAGAAGRQRGQAKNWLPHGVQVVVFSVLVGGRRCHELFAKMVFENGRWLHVNPIKASARQKQEVEAKERGR